MKRRTFLRGCATAVAIGLAPAFLNATKLNLAETGRRIPYRFGKTEGEVIAEISTPETITLPNQGTFISRIWADNELVYENKGENAIVDNGHNGYTRVEFDKTITKKADETLDMTWEYRLKDSKKTQLIAYNVGIESLQ